MAQLNESSKYVGFVCSNDGLASTTSGRVKGRLVAIQPTFTWTLLGILLQGVELYKVVCSHKCVGTVVPTKILGTD